MKTLVNVTMMVILGTIIILCLFFISSFAQEITWRYLTSSVLNSNGDSTKVFIRNFTEKEKRILYGQFTNRIDIAVNKDKRYLMTKWYLTDPKMTGYALEEYDCNLRTNRTLKTSLDYFTIESGFKISDYKNIEWEEVSPGSVVERILETVCIYSKEGL